MVLENSGAAQNPDTQYWHVVTKADGNETLLNKSGGREAAVWTGSATVGQRIGQWVDNSAPGLWNLMDNGNGYVRFQAIKNTNVYLTGSAATGSAAGSPLTLQNAATDGSQDWQLVAEPQPQAKTLLGAQSGKCLDLFGSDTRDGAVVDIYTCDGGMNQNWTLDSSGQLVNAHSGKCLDVKAQSTSNGAVVQQWSCTGGGNQKWTYNQVTRQLLGQQSGKCLDVNQGSTANGSRVVIWSCSSQTNQQWTMR